ncbi:MAG TPA: acetyl-CoA C-acyltransferase, partial [Verrucomicrobiae bacterium]|nr:acetyl-CoA C-acyltransferase [Verrucomicrobiae bacterium]
MHRESDIVVAAPVRTPIGKFGGALSGCTAAELGAAAASAAIARAGVPPAELDELIFGNARQAGGGPNVARQIAHRAGLPVEVPAYTVNRACGSGLQAIVSAAQAIKAG